jgi:hypothetical protein
MKYFSCNVTKSWDGKNKETLKSESARVLLGNLIIDLRWKSAETGNDPYYALGLMIKKKLGEIVEIMHISYSPVEKEFYYSFLLFRKMRNFVLRVVHFRRIKQLKEKITYYRESAADIWLDPMCGCPEDFCEDWSRKAQRLEHQLYNKYYR